MSSVNSHPSAFTASIAAPTTTSTTSSSDSNSSQTSLTSLGSTFLSLLTQELQNQDPTAPMDSTQMVGQMISLNELDQTASINQLLTNTLGSSTSSASTDPTSPSSPTSPTSPTAGAIAAQQAATAAAYAAMQNGSLAQTMAANAPSVGPSSL